MRANRESAEAANAWAISAKKAPESTRRGSESDEWTWMVDEDPAFYLNESGTARAGRSV